MGKVHGSLARAGKVKAATPKVGFLPLFPTLPFGLYREVVDVMDDGWMDTRHRWAKRRKQKFLSGKKKKKKNWADGILPCDMGRYNRMDNKC